jgi:signal transduction histidine kinase/CheY-like chemotaxis protein
MRKDIFKYIRYLLINEAEIDSENFKKFLLNKNFSKFILLLMFSVIISFIMLLFAEFSGDDKRIIYSNIFLFLFSFFWLFLLIYKRNRIISDWLFFIPIMVLTIYISYLLGNFSFRSEFFATYATSMFIIAVMYSTSWQKTMLVFLSSIFYLYFFTPYVHSGPLSYSSVNIITVFNIVFAAWFVSRVVYSGLRKEYENKTHMKNTVSNLNDENRKNKVLLSELQNLKIELEDIIQIRTEAFQKAKLDAESSDRTKSVFLANMSHELRTPLSGRYEVFNEPFDPVELFNNSASLFKLKAIEKGLDFKVFIDKKDMPSYVLSEPKRIKLILDNVIGNAVKFTENGYIHCSISFLKKSKNKQNCLLLMIRDTGIGISGEIQESIFDFFSQEEKRNDHPSLGLGLTIVKEYIGKMEGKISLESKKNSGTTFEIVLPVEITSENSYDTDVKRNYVIEGIKKVLVAEDNQINRFLLKKILEENNYTVIEAENGEIAVNQFLKHDIDVVLMDIQMPVLNGYQALKKIRELKNHKYVPVMAITSYTSSSDKNEMIKSGFDAFLPKPFDKKNLLEKLNEFQKEGE